MARRKKNKNKKIIGITVAILAFILIIILLVINLYDPVDEAVKEYGYETMGVYQDSSIEVPEIDIQFSGVSVFLDYNGTLPVSSVTSELKTILKEKIPKYVAEIGNYTNEQLEEYFEKNEAEILEDLHIDNVESLENMIKFYVNLASGVTDEYATCGFTDNDEYITMTLTYASDIIIECDIYGSSANNFTLEF